MSEILTTEVSDKVAVITLNRPDTLNALSAPLRDELANALSGCRDDDAIGAIVLTGAGRGFCSGADMSGLATALEVAQQMLQWPPLALRMSKRVLQHSQEHDLETALRYEMVGLGFAGRARNDAKESRAAFVEKRPNYTGT